MKTGMLFGVALMGLAFGVEIGMAAERSLERRPTEAHVSAPADNTGKFAPGFYVIESADQSTFLYMTFESAWHVAPYDR